MDRNYPGPCNECCLCNAPYCTFVTRSASKSKSSCSVLNPSDGKYYQTITTSTTISGYVVSGCTGAGFSRSASYYSTVNYDPTTCANTTTCGGSWACNYVTCVTAGTLGSDCVWTGTNTYPTEVIDFTGPGDDCQERNPSSDCVVGDTTTNTTSYTNEFTTAALKSATVAALPSWRPIPPFTVCSLGEVASAELATDESSYSIMQGKYQFAWQPSISGCYEIIWNETFTPDGGGSPTVTPKTFTWDGIIPSGYNPLDPSTWPNSDIFEVDQPSSNGSISITDITFNCNCS